ncbi:MAG: type 1 glutamine amidotransferase domain-containing protein [Flavobacteriaceae bacterium]|nr:type 1 glutamine amidotransferase domain-containing protein [Flavobacteriaceae bacterium]
MAIKKVLIPLPSYGFDPTEAAIPWKLMRENNFEIVFITPNGEKAAADKLMVSGEKLGVFKSVLKARQDAVNAYLEMEQSKSFCNPQKYDAVSEKDFDAILLPGGHDKSVKEYLESETLQQLIVAFFKAKKPVAAVCHGVILVARSIDSVTGKSVIYNYKTTSLLKSQELLAYNLTRLWLKDYYLTYPDITTEDEVRSVLSNQNNFIKGPTPLLKDNLKNLKRGFVVRDRNYLSARWPGDIYNFSLEFIKMVQEV